MYLPDYGSMRHSAHARIQKQECALLNYFRSLLNFHAYAADVQQTTRSFMFFIIRVDLKVTSSYVHKCLHSLI